MPEGDTIWRAAAAMRPRLVGRVVVAARPARVAGLVGHTVSAVEAHGKHLLLRFDGGLALHTHMRMTGSWHLYSPGERWQRPARQARVVLEYADVVAVCFNAPIIEVVRDGAAAIAHLGPDILAEPFDLEEVLRRARFAAHPTLGELLLDQRVCAGIGNIYRCDSLWMLQLNPWTPPGSLDEQVVRQCYSVARGLMQRALGTAGQRSLVHARSGRPCPRCGTPISLRAQGVQARLVYWCARCQGPSPLPRGASSPLGRAAGAAE